MIRARPRLGPSPGHGGITRQMGVHHRGLRLNGAPHESRCTVREVAQRRESAGRVKVGKVVDYCKIEGCPAALCTERSQQRGS